VTESIIEARALTKTYWVARRRAGVVGALRGLVERSGREIHAVDSISFAIAAGEVVAYVGPNGAGKSTTIKMLTGILVPTRGEARVVGLVPWRQRKILAHRIGVVFGQRTQLWWDLPLIESLELLRHLYRVPAPRFQANLAELRNVLELDPFLDTPVRQLSLGQRMRGDLAASVLHDPAMLYLDEPTIGLDVVAKARVREFLQRMNREKGVTILLTTHDLADVEALCQRMIVIDHGRIIFDGAIEALKRRYGGQRTLVVDLAEGAEERVIELPGAVLVKQEGPRRWLQFSREAMSAAELIGAVVARYPVRDVVLEEPAIEAIVRQIYEEGAGSA
jgi:ABC-2 type transport system ATP-binding protein